MIWPPSNAISIRTRSGSATCNHLRENAVDGIGVDERHLEPEETGAGAFVDQICTCGRQLRQRRIEVGHLVRDVVHPRPSLLEEAADGRVLPERLEQLDTTCAASDRRGTDSLSCDCRAMLDPCAEQTLVGRESRVEVLD